MIKIKLTGKAGTIELESQAIQVRDINGQPALADNMDKYDIAHIYREMAKTDNIELDEPVLEEGK